MSTPSTYQVTATHETDLTNNSLESLSKSPNQFNRLSDSEIQTVKEGLVDKVGLECFAKCWPDLCKWKENNFDAQCSVERLFKQATDSGYPVRSNQGREDFDSNDGLFADTVVDLSNSLGCYPVQTDSESDTELILYRGIGYEIPYVVASAIDDPNRASYSIPVASVMANYTPDKIQAAGYSPIIFRKNIDVSDILIASDYMLRHSTKAKGLLTTDAECRVDGNVTSAANANEIAIVKWDGREILNEYSIQSFFNDMPTPNHPMHKHFAEMIKDLSDRIKIIDEGRDDPRDPLIVSSDTGKERLTRWCDNCMTSDERLADYPYESYTEAILDR